MDIKILIIRGISFVSATFVVNDLCMGYMGRVTHAYARGDGLVVIFKLYGGLIVAHPNSERGYYFFH